MAQIKFGPRQVVNPTPANFERFVKIFIGITGLFLAWMPTNNLVPQGVQDIISPINNLVNSVLLFLLPYFGVKIETDMIPKEDVAVIETNPS